LVTKTDAIDDTKWQQTRVQLFSHDFEAATCVATWGAATMFSLSESKKSKVEMLQMEGNKPAWFTVQTILGP
jgi:hypothetical protein